MFTLKLSFNPQERDHKKNLELVNAALDTMKLSEINIKNIKSYTAATETFDKDGKSTSKNYFFGFDEIEFICKARKWKGTSCLPNGCSIFSKRRSQK